MWSSLRGCPQRRISFRGNLQTFFKLKPIIIQNFEKTHLIKIEQIEQMGVSFVIHENVVTMKHKQIDT